jgi:hypothetical protein
VVDRLDVVVDVRFVLVFGRQVLVGIVSVTHRSMIVFVLVCGVQMLEATMTNVPVVGDVVMAVAVGHGFVAVLLPLGLGIGHRLPPFGLVSVTIRRCDPSGPRLMVNESMLC